MTRNSFDMRNKLVKTNRIILQRIKIRDNIFFIYLFRCACGNFDKMTVRVANGSQECLR